MKKARAPIVTRVVEVQAPILIHAHPSNFQLIVQKLTGNSSSTESSSIHSSSSPPLATTNANSTPINPTNIYSNSSYTIPSFMSLQYYHNVSGVDDDDAHVHSTNNNLFTPYDIHHQLHEDNLDHKFYHCVHDHMDPPHMVNVLPRGTSDSSSSSSMNHMYAIPRDNVSTSCSPCTSPHFTSDCDLSSYFMDQLDQDFDPTTSFNDHQH